MDVKGKTVVCPLRVATPMTENTPDSGTLRDGVMSADEATAVIMEGIADDRFMIFTHPPAGAYWGQEGGGPRPLDRGHDADETENPRNCGGVSLQRESVNGSSRRHCE